MADARDIYEDGLDKRPANFTPLTPLNFLIRAARVYPDQLALVHGARRSTYRHFYERCVRLASALSGFGGGSGDTVSVMVPNIPEVLEANFGVPMLDPTLGYRLCISMGGASAGRARKF